MYAAIPAAVRRSSSSWTSSSVSASASNDQRRRAVEFLRPPGPLPPSGARAPPGREPGTATESSGCGSAPSAPARTARRAPRAAPALADTPCASGAPESPHQRPRPNRSCANQPGCRPPKMAHRTHGSGSLRQGRRRRYQNQPPPSARARPPNPQRRSRGSSHQAHQTPPPSRTRPRETAAAGSAGDAGSRSPPSPRLRPSSRASAAANLVGAARPRTIAGRPLRRRRSRRFRARLRPSGDGALPARHLFHRKRPRLTASAALRGHLDRGLGARGVVGVGARPALARRQVVEPGTATVLDLPGIDARKPPGPAPPTRSTASSSRRFR